MSTRALNTLLAGAVDYAGLFPPAQLAMSEAVRAYAGYRRGDRAWMLGAFILPAGRAAEFLDAAALHAGGAEIPVSVLLGNDPEADAAGPVAALRGADTLRVSVVSCEARTPTEEAVHRAAGAAAGLFPLFCEVPPDDPVPLLQAVRSAGVRAKVRTGGVTADLFPSPLHLARFLLACARLRIPFKATAGLHHPLRGEYPLTYEENAPRGLMYGFLNVLAAGAFARAGATPDDVQALLTERHPGSVTFSDDGLAWRGRRLDAEDLVEFRRSGMTGFGSCSFAEPIQDLTSLGLL